MTKKWMILLAGLALVGCAQVKDDTVKPYRYESGKMNVRRFIDESQVKFDTYFERWQYEIIGDVKGTGVVAIISNTNGYVIEWEKKSGFYYDEGLNFTPGDVETLAIRAALYDAVTRNPGVDYVILPRYELKHDVYTETNHKPPYFNIITVTATVFGKGIRIKSDKELYQTDRDFIKLMINDRKKPDETK